jgi:23S rRNA (uracil1939-C5)-methyltransferase
MESVSANVVTQENFEVTIERILPGGLGLAHADGRTVMVALAAPGDRLRVSVDRVKGNVAFALIEEVIEPSPQRVDPPCQYFGRCGGCDFQQLTYQAQLDAKVEIIKDCLHRIGRIENVPDFQITPAPNPWHYRTRAQWQYDAIRRKLGYFESGSRRVCDVAECAVLAPQLQQTLSVLRERMQEGSLPEDARDFRAVAGDEGVSLAPDPGGNPTVREGADPKLNREEVRVISRQISGETYRLNAERFFQANGDLVPQLIDAALNEASGETAVELYCGVGLFTVPLARRFVQVSGIEGDAAATRFARANLESANLENTQIINQDVGDWLEHDAAARLSGRDESPQADFLLLDPPRTGAESRVIAGVLTLKPKRISYVSCDPATLARDLRKLIGGGCTLESIAAFDMFPQTHHVETVVRLLL